MREDISNGLGFDKRVIGGAPVLARRTSQRSNQLHLAPAVVGFIALLAACGDSTPAPSGVDASSAKDGAGAADTSTGGDVAKQPDTGSTADTGIGSDVNTADVDMSDVGIVETGPPPSLCDGKPKKPLPFNIHSDFTQIVIIGPEKVNFTRIANPDCTATTFPPIPPPIVPPPAPDGGGDAGEAGASDAATDALVTTDAAATDAVATTDAAPTTDAAASRDASAESGGETGTDAAAPPPSCYEFLYNPSCTTGATGLCWAGTIFQSPMSLPDQGSAGAGGICIETGAVQVKFSARASRDQARIKFGSTRAGAGSTETYLTVATTWQMYSVMIPVGEPYNDYTTNGGVWNGFSLVVEPSDHIGDGSPGDGGTYILVKDVTWSK